MKRAAILGALLLALSACGSASSGPSAAAGGVPADQIRAQVLTYAKACGDADPTITYVRTDRQSADLGPGIHDYTVQAGRTPVYAVVARGHFTCTGWADYRPVPALRTRLRLTLPADGSPLVPYRVVIDAHDDPWPERGTLTPLP